MGILFAAYFTLLEPISKHFYDITGYFLTKSCKNMRFEDVSGLKS